jgi:hypothetical protein
VKTPAKKKVKTNTKDVTASPAFFTACEKIPSKRKNVKSRNTKARKKINFDQQVGTQIQSLSQRFGNPPKATYLCVSWLTRVTETLRKTETLTLTLSVRFLVKVYFLSRFFVFRLYVPALRRHFLASCKKCRRCRHVFRIRFHRFFCCRDVATAQF